MATNLLGPAPGRHGERGRRLWWPCPFHEDRNPSLAVAPGSPWWRCYGCDAGGDAATLVMRLEGMSFPEAVSSLTGGPTLAREAAPRPAAKPRPGPPAEPSGLPEADALALVEAAAARLWTPEGVDALDYLHGRGLTDETIREARLGYAPPLDLPGRPRGVVLAWFDGGRLALVKIRRPEGSRPKYREIFRDRPTIYPGPDVIRPGRPLVITEGELDALLLGQELADLASVVTLGSASSRPGPATLGAMLSAPVWSIATDNDPAGDKAASGWPARARRVRPPGAFKDWTEARQGGVDLRRWWGDVLDGIDRPPLFTWEEASALRWGPAIGDPTPGLDVGIPF